MFVLRLIQSYRVSQRPDHLQGKIREFPDISGIILHPLEGRIIIASFHEMLRQIMLASAMGGEASISGMSDIIRLEENGEVGGNVLSLIGSDCVEVLKVQRDIPACA
jgi:hypothetical protein